MTVAALARSCVEYEGRGADGRLDQLGLTRTSLMRAVAEGDGRRALVSPLSPRTYAGQVMWAETVTSLREQLISSALDWVPDSTSGYETVCSERFGLCVAVVGGNERTGRRGLPHPSTARPRGPVTRLRVAANYGKAAPLPGMELAEDRADSIVTWFLMAYAARDRIQTELSMPLICGQDGYILAWSERILLDDVASAGGVTPVDVEAAHVPTFDVRRR